MNYKHAYPQKEGDSGNYNKWTVISDSDKDTREHTLTVLDNGTKYYFKIAACIIFNNIFIAGLDDFNGASAMPMVPTAGVTVSKARLTITEGSEGTYNTPKTVMVNAMLVKTQPMTPTR